jgi:hypothetical protein
VARQLNECSQAFQEELARALASGMSCSDDEEDEGSEFTDAELEQFNDAEGDEDEDDDED